MTLQSSPQNIALFATRGGAPSPPDPSPRCTHPQLVPTRTSPGSAPNIPSPLSEVFTSAQQQQLAHAFADAPSPRQSRGAEEEWSTEISRYGLSSATPALRVSLLGDQVHRSSIDSTDPSPTGPASTLPELSTASPSTASPATANPAKRSSDADASAADSSPRSRKKRCHRIVAPRHADLTDPSKPLSLSTADCLTSPLFFSNTQKPLMVRPPSYSGSDVTVGTMLRSVREANSSDVTTLKLARGTVSAASPARSSSTPTSWTSIDAACFARSPDVHGANPSLQALHGIGILDLLERDDRPTFVFDGANGANMTLGLPFVILYENPALQVSPTIRHLIAGDFEDGSEAKNDFCAFKAWIRTAGNQTGASDVFWPSYEYGGFGWTCAVVKHRFRFVSANRSAASIARISPEPTLVGRDASNSPGVSPKTPSDIDVPDAVADYFSDLAQLDDGEPPALPSFNGSDGEDELLMGHRLERSGFSSDFGLRPGLQPSFDWTRIPLTNDLPKHITFARTRDWASTPLGPIEDWSSDLRAMANMVMASPHPAAMYWGPEFIAIYNEAYVPMAGQKHPALMGRSYRDAWDEIWDSIAPIFEGAWESGQATMKNDDRLLVNRYGFEEETFFSWSIVPLVGEDGSVVGLYNPAFENTRRKIAERRMLTLREIGEKTALARDVKSFWSQVKKGLEYNEEDVPFAMVYSVSDDAESDMSSMHSGSLSHPPQLILEASMGIPQGHSCLGTTLDLKTSTEGFAPYMRDSMAQQGTPIILSKNDGTLAEGLMEGFEFRGNCPCTSIVIFPVHPTTGGESVVGFIVMGLNPRRPYDEDYQLFIHLLSRQLATSMASVVLFEEEIRRGQRAARMAALDRQELTKELHLRTKEVEESELKFTRMAEFAPVGMFIANHEGLFNFCNDMWWDISQHPRFEPVDSWMDSVKEEDRPALQQVWRRLIEVKVAITHEFRFKCSRVDGGNTIDNWVLMSAYPEKDEDGGIKGIFGCITNISQQKLAEGIQRQRREEAVELKRQQENFIDITSHEMRNPLSAILQCADEIAGILSRYRSKDTYAEQAEEVRVALESCLEAANTITLCASHQKRIVDDVLTLSKLDSNLLLVTPVDVQPVSVVQRALKMFEGELNTNGIKLTFLVKNRYLDMGADWVKLDPSRLLQVLINLMTNAIKFTHSRPERSIIVTLDASVDISERTDKDIGYFPSDRADRGDLTDNPDWGDGEKINLQFSVQDTGRGLDEHEKTLLFQRFSQTTPRTHVQYGGSGLGLFISRILTELQGGQIGVKSQKGVGSTFSFYVRSRKSNGPVNTQALAAVPPLTRAPGSSTTVERREPPSSDAENAAEAPPPAAELKAPAPPGSRLFDVLIVEDNLVNQKVLQRQLRNSGNRTLVANHGGEALDVLAKSRFWAGRREAEAEGVDISVILMDLEMPVMDGMTCSRRIRELEREGQITSHIPIIAVTAYARPEQIEDAKAAGIDDVISKPFRIPELIPKIEELVDRYPCTRSSDSSSSASAT